MSAKGERTYSYDGNRQVGVVGGCLGVSCRISFVGIDESVRLDWGGVVEGKPCCPRECSCQQSKPFGCPCFSAD